MEPFVKLKGQVVSLDRVNVDTDQIIPKQFLKRIERTGFGQYLFFDWRFLGDGSENPDFILNSPKYSGATVLASGRNFGSGSSREHAPWALIDYGFRCILAPSFADIFYNNCFQNGLLPIIMAEDVMTEIMLRTAQDARYFINIDLEKQLVWDENKEVSEKFHIEPFRKYCLINGLDDIDLTLKHSDAIAAYESG